MLRYKILMWCGSAHRMQLVLMKHSKPCSDTRQRLRAIHSLHREVGSSSSWMRAG